MKDCSKNVSSISENQYYKWYGLNSNNRFVGSGTFYLLIRYQSESGDIITLKRAINIKR